MRPDAQDYQALQSPSTSSSSSTCPHHHIVNEAPPAFDVLTVKARITETYGCEVIGVLPYSQEIAALASRGIFALRYPQHPVTAALRDIAAKLAA